MRTYGPLSGDTSQFLESLLPGLQRGLWRFALRAEGSHLSVWRAPSSEELTCKFRGGRLGMIRERRTFPSVPFCRKPSGWFPETGCPGYKFGRTKRKHVSLCLVVTGSGVSIRLRMMNAL